MWFPRVGVCVTIVTCIALGAAQDPCQAGNYQELNDTYRSVKYMFSYPKIPECDVSLTRAWYRFTGPAGDMMPETCVPRTHCGTQAPVWINGTHPNVTEGIVQRTSCANYGSDRPLYGPCCDIEIDIEIKNCGSFYVYHLSPTDSCPISYCGGDKDVCTQDQWSLNGMPPCKEGLFPKFAANPILRGPAVRNSSFWFSCHFDLAQDPDNMIEVLWTVNGNNTWKKLFLDPDRVAYLDGSFLKGHLGSTIGCKVRSNYRGSQYASPWLSSNTYWVGLQTEPSRLEISEKEELRNVLLTSTIPILCSSPGDGGCCLSLRLDVEGYRQNLVTAGDCEYKLCARENVSDTASVNIPLMAVRDLIDDGDVELLLSFQVIQAGDGDLNPSVFEGYRALTTNITVRDVEIPSCSWTGDSHIHGFESSLSFNLYNVGDYTMYENPSRAFEIQARTWPCNGGNVTCVCGIAIRELNEIIRIDQCDQPYGSPHTSPLVTVYSQPLRDGTVILRSSDGSKIVVNLPSGTGISVDARSWGLNVHLPASPVDEGKGRGVCGTFDGDPLNEFTHRNGYVDSSSLLPINFTESWRNNKTQSLFESLQPKVVEPDATKYCSCDTGSADVTRSNCTSRRHVSIAAFNCPNCPDITDRLTVVAGGALNATDLDEQDARFEPDNFTDFQPANPTWPTPSNLTEEQARVKCQEGLRSSQLWTHCQSVQKIVDSYQQDCVADVLFGDTYDLVESATASFTEECQAELSKDPDNYVTSSTGEIVMKAELSADLCSATCLRHGTCNRGHCVCNTGYTGDNCHLLEGQGPQLSRIRNSNACDVNERPCRKVFIDVTNIALTDQLKCRVQEVLTDGSVLPDMSVEDGDFLSAGRLACNLPDARVKSDKSVKHYILSSTNDGSLYGNQLNITVYDGRCQTCNGTSCYHKTTACLINSLCYEEGEHNPSNASEVCRVSDSTTQWTPLPPVLADFPVITAVSLIRSPSNDTLLVCDINSKVTAPTARYRLSWGVDGLWREEQEVDSGHLTASVTVSDQPNGVQVACRARSYFTDHNIFSPFTISNVIFLQTADVG